MGLFSRRQPEYTYYYSYRAPVGSPLLTLVVLAAIVLPMERLVFSKWAAFHRHGTPVSSGVNVRRGPGTHYPATSVHLFEGEIVRILGEEDGWFEISRGIFITGGYVRADLIEESAGGSE